MEVRIVRKFKPAGALHSPMMSYLRRHYSGVLGDDIAHVWELLDEPGGLAELQRRCVLRFKERYKELTQLKKAA